MGQKRKNTNVRTGKLQVCCFFWGKHKIYLQLFTDGWDATLVKRLVELSQTRRYDETASPVLSDNYHYNLIGCVKLHLYEAHDWL